MRKIEKVMLIVFLVISVICGKFLLDYWQDSYDNRQNYREVEEIVFPEKDTEDDDTESNADNPMTAIDDFDYQALLDENSDCIGWLKIDGIDISYPVVQGENNEFYLYHDFQKNYAICGTLMLDCRNDIEAGQEHLIIYDHQMKDGSMFKQLNEYKKEEYYPEHKEITLFLKNQKYQYEVAAVYVTMWHKAAVIMIFYTKKYENSRWIIYSRWQFISFIRRVLPSGRMMSCFLYLPVNIPAQTAG